MKKENPVAVADNIWKEKNRCCHCRLFFSATRGRIFPSPQQSIVHPRDKDYSAHGGIFTKCGHKKSSRQESFSPGVFLSVSLSGILSA